VSIEDGTCQPENVYGVPDKWNMPASVRRLRSGDRLLFSDMPHYVATLHLRGGRVLSKCDHTTVDVGTNAVSFSSPEGSDALNGTEGVEVGQMFFAPALLQEVAEAIGVTRSCHTAQPFFGRRDAAVSSVLADYLTRATDAGDPPTTLEMDSRAYLAGLALLGLAGETCRDAAPRGVKKLTRAQVEEVLALLESKISGHLRLADVAATVNLSPFYFARAFQATVGESPAACLRRLRLEKARDLIVQTRLSLAEIAFSTGFSSQAHMTYRFTKVYKRTPCSFRRARPLDDELPVNRN
jgi:AraC-like DNA-binding protein